MMPGKAAIGRGHLVLLWRALALAVLLAGGKAEQAQAQDVGIVQSDIVVLDTERLFNDTMIGQRLSEDYQEEREKLIAHNREIEAELRAQELALTEKRPTMSPDEFREAADAFDAKVRAIRDDNERIGRDLERAREAAPLTMLRMAQPALAELMRDAGAQIVLDNRQVLLRADVIDITDIAIVRIDAAIGDGRPPPNETGDPEETGAEKTGTDDPGPEKEPSQPNPTPGPTQD